MQIAEPIANRRQEYESSPKAGEDGWLKRRLNSVNCMTTNASRLANARKASNLKQPAVTSGQTSRHKKSTTRKQYSEAVVDQ
jgi:hypothetical protein